MEGGPAIGDIVQAVQVGSAFVCCAKQREKRRACCTDPFRMQVQTDPAADKGSRQAAHALCEQVKAHDGLAFEVAGQLFNPSMPPPVRHFALGLYEHLITKRWTLLSAESKAQMKEVSLQIISQWPVDEAAAAPFLKHKAVQVLVPTSQLL
jgi:hypothetical protein